ncbi:M56 family metallopeptidase [Flagellimonas profundi]|uniref:TonB-dependent receptor plug domain-containing protein n=1 Tax=Flagellimonas profundi TaxID=2915620 RepID=A0ABS3FGB9_9FLAO|nr:M56 family metallopeptidase [Allomuricauda profundi]MBO0341755.1 TonB-dependent receptor plug domain-containing protein [Allomuricauda profundi]
MESIYMYFLQSALISGGFLAVYHIFLKQETFFKENRLFLLSGLVLSFVFPLIKIQKTIVVSKPVLVQATDTGTRTISTIAESNLFTPQNVLFTVYITISAFLFVKFLFKLISLKHLAKDAQKRRETPFMHLETEKNISPFSFFNYLFYNPRLFEANELHSVLEHEKVHARQYHTVDILLLEILKILFWFNPVLWVYKSAVRENLEYLADHFAIAQTGDKKSYQYLMLKQAVDTQEYALANSFYNSLIKKRIVMLNQNQSKKINILKTLVVTPLLGLFLVSFSIEETYLYKEPDSVENLMKGETVKDNKTVELTIDKNTSDAELDNIKKDLAKDGIDFSYTTVRNDDREIISITLNLSGKNSEGKTFSGNYNSNSDGPINPITVLYDDENNAVSFWNAHKETEVRIHKMGKGNVSWSTSDEKEIIVKKVDGKRKVIINGEEVSEDKLHSMDVHLDSEDGKESVFIVKRNGDDKNVKIEKLGNKKDGVHVMKIIDSDDDEVEVKKSTNVMIIKDSDDDEVISGDDDGRFFYIKSDGKQAPLYIIDGKKVKSKDLEKISPEDIENVNVFKGDKAIEKYGKKAKNGVVEITTKKGN